MDHLYTPNHYVKNNHIIHLYPYREATFIINTKLYTKNQTYGWGRNILWAEMSRGRSVGGA